MGNGFGCDSMEINRISDCGRHRNVEYNGNKKRTSMSSSQSGSYHPQHPHGVTPGYHYHPSNHAYNPHGYNGNQPMIQNQQSQNQYVANQPRMQMQYSNPMSPQMSNPMSPQMSNQMSNQMQSPHTAPHMTPQHSSQHSGQHHQNPQYHQNVQQPQQHQQQSQQQSQQSQQAQQSNQQPKQVKNKMNQQQQQQQQQQEQIKHQIDPRLSGGVQLPHIVADGNEGSYDSDGSRSDSRSRSSDEDDDIKGGKGKDKDVPAVSRQSVFEMQQMMAGMKQQENARVAGYGGVRGIGGNNGGYNAAMMYNNSPHGARIGAYGNVAPYSPNNRFAAAPMHQQQQAQMKAQIQGQGQGSQSQPQGGQSPIQK